VANYANFSDADLILVTHEHGDHFNVETLTGLIEENTKLIVNPAIFEPMPESLRAISTAMADGDILEMMEIGGAATPAYNLTENRMKYHPQGRDNGYLLTVDGMHDLHRWRYRGHTGDARDDRHRLCSDDFALYNGRNRSGQRRVRICTWLCLSLPLPRVRP
jgi:L-ascorbate metabolism protein UlaG (beta-lactamase superfamily)